MCRRYAVLVLVLAGALAGAGPAAAQSTVLAPVPDTAGITAYRGHVVLSHRDAGTGRWSLVRWHAGVVDRLPVPDRAIPFDADAGPDADGDPVVVYSRCSTEPPATDGLSPAADFAKARGCDLYEVPLTAAAPRERRLTSVSRPGRSESTPSVWRGAIAFADRKDGAVMPHIRYRPAGTTRVRDLGGGSLPACGEYCRRYPSFRRAISVQQLDLGPERVAYLWQMIGGAIYGTGIGWELRTATLDGGRSVLHDTGLISGTCGFSLPSAASASSTPVTYLDAGSPCEVKQITTAFATVDPRTGDRATAAVAGLAAGLARDGDTLYWVRIADRTSEPAPPGALACTDAGTRCELVATPVPAFTPQPRRRQSPPGDIDLVGSGLGYRWVTGPEGVGLLRPPATVPCAPSKAAADVYVSARWTRGKHRVRVLRTDPDGGVSQLGFPITRSLPDGVVAAAPRLLTCGARMRVTYVVGTGRSARRVTFTVTRRRA